MTSKKFSTIVTCIFTPFFAIPSSIIVIGESAINLLGKILLTIFLIVVLAVNFYNMAKYTSIMVLNEKFLSICEVLDFVISFLNILAIIVLYNALRYVGNNDEELVKTIIVASFLIVILIFLTIITRKIKTKTSSKKR